MTTQTFAEFGVSASVDAALAGRGMAHPFPIQALVIPDALAGRDVLARSRTGSGKTLAFAIPIVERTTPAPSGPAHNRERPRALVLVPTRELASQVVEEFEAVARATGLRVAAAYGGVSIREQADRVNHADILVATPGRLQDLIDRRLTHLGHVRILILDEADRMLDMGFAPQVDKIVRHLPGERQTMLFSATLDGAVARLARAYTHDPVRHEVDAERPTVEDAEHRFVPVTEQGKVDALVDLLRQDEGLALVFVRTKRGADRLVRRLEQKGVRAAAMHGDLSQQQRERALERFHAKKVTTLVATDVAARGLDVDGIAHVINYDPPNDDNGYVHRVGRTARAGKSGIGVTLVTPEQHGDVSRMAARLQLGADFERSGLTVAPPRMVFTSRGRKAGMRRRVGAGSRGRR
jgi:ATP-dependent RNA helicase RhlE